MGFIDSYKHLEKLCGDMLNDDRRLSAYIDEMIGISNGAYYVRNWEYDLKQLKHYRWVRNQIVHEPGCTEQNMCTQEDTLWIENFYARILDRTDPLAQYYKAIKPRPKAERVRALQNHTYATNNTGYKVPPKKRRGNILVWTYILFIVLFIVAMMIFILKIYCR